MYVTDIPNRNSSPTTLLRQSYRQDGKVKSRTLANLTHWPKQKIGALRRLLRGDTMVSPEDVFTVEASRPHGHVELILATVRKLGLDRLISAKRCRERDLVIAMIVERILHPCSKLATSRLWHNTTLPEELSVEDAKSLFLEQAFIWCPDRDDPDPGFGDAPGMRTGRRCPHACPRCLDGRGSGRPAPSPNVQAPCRPKAAGAKASR